MIIINDLKIAQELFTKRGLIYSDRPRSVMHGELSESHNTTIAAVINMYLGWAGRTPSGFFHMATSSGNSAK